MTSPSPVPTDIVRVLRLVQYVGPRVLVEEQVHSSIHGTRLVMAGRAKDTGLTLGVLVTAVTIGEFPETLPVGATAACVGTLE